VLIAAILVLLVIDVVTSEKLVRSPLSNNNSENGCVTHFMIMFAEKVQEVQEPPQDHNHQHDHRERGADAGRGRRGRRTGQSQAPSR